MKNIPEVISPLIESQFPSFYHEEGPKFITFLKSYYEWLEQSNNALYHARRLLNYRDIDKTVDDFIVYFKEETLKNIQFDIATDKKLLVKNALDFYRSKGTERSIDLFFKLVYAQPASVRYPGDDILKLSDNTWKIANYIEVSETEFNSKFEGKQITGLQSGATAFVDNYSIKKKINDQTDISGNKVQISKNIHVFFLSNIVGNFIYGEKVIHTGTTDPRDTPVVIGSLNQLEVIVGASNYVVGDIVDLYSNTGTNAKAIVSSIINTTGQVQFTLLDGGWGYTTSPKILIAEKTLIVNNVIVSNSSLVNPFIQFETLIQPKANINFKGLTGNFNANDIVYTYYANNSLAGTGKIISIQPSSVDTTTGDLYVSILSGNLTANDRFYNVDNTVYANTNIYIDRTASANITSITSNNVLHVNDVQNGILFSLGERIYQSNSTLEWANGTISAIVREGAGLQISVSNVNGIFNTNQRVKGSASNANANLVFYSTIIGINDSTATSIKSISIVANGQNYSNGNLISVISTTGTGTFAYVNTNSSGNISKITLVRSGTGYKSVPLVTIKNVSVTKFFNANSDVNDSSNFINLSDHGFVNAQAIKYLVSQSNTALSGLSNNSTYYVRVANSSGITLSNTPKGNVINISPGLSENGHSFTSIVSNGNGAILVASLGDEFDYENPMLIYGKKSNTTSILQTAGSGSLASFKVASIDNEELVLLNSDRLSDHNIYGADYLDMLIDGNPLTTLSDDGTYGFPANPSANLSFGTIETCFALDEKYIGSISLISKTNPGEDYNIPPLVTVIEPSVCGYGRYDYIMTIEENTSRFTLGENILLSNRRNFDAKNNVNNLTSNFIEIPNNRFSNGTVVTYTVATGNTVIGGLANGYNYYVLEANTSGVKLSLIPTGPAIVLTPSASYEIGHYLQTNSFSNIGKLKNIINQNTMRVTRTSLFINIPDTEDTFIKGDISDVTTLVTNIVPDSTLSGLNAKVQANVVIANGAVNSLTVIDSGFGYERFDISSFSRSGDPNATVGLCKAIVETQGKSEGFFESTKGFLSQDKYIHDGDFYQDYSYELISRVPYERYANMLKRVLHVAGTKMFPAVYVESSIGIPLKSQKNIEIRKTFNPTTAINTTTDFIAITDNIFANSESVVYTVDSGNSAVLGLANNTSYYIAYANSSGFKLSTTANGSSIVNLTAPLPNEVGHGIHNII